VNVVVPAFGRVTRYVAPPTKKAVAEAPGLAFPTAKLSLGLIEFAPDAKKLR
jgi:hypothetical protein